MKPTMFDGNKLFPILKSFCCSLDAATQAVFLLPHWAVEDKDVSACKRIPMHLMGCLCHGRNVYCYAFTDNIKHGANALIEILHRVLFHEWQQTRSLPPTFYVQLDNTTKQCKNKFVLGYLSLIVAWDLVDRVIFSFLPVGHTHEDVGMFLFCLDRESTLVCIKPVKVLYVRRCC